MNGNGDGKGTPAPEGAGGAAGGQEASGDVVDAVMAALAGDEDGGSGKSPEELDLEALARGDGAGEGAGQSEAKADAGGGEAGTPGEKAGGGEAGTPGEKAGEGDGGQAPGTAQDGAGEAQGKAAPTGPGQAEQPPGDAQATGDGAGEGAGQDDGAKADDDLVTLDDLKVPDAFATIPDEAARAAVTAQWEKVGRAVQYEFARANQAEEAYHALARPIQEARATREQLTDMLAVVAGLNSREPARLEQVDTYLGQIRAEIARTLGKAPPGEDALAGFPDLAAAVEAGDVERKWAEELAAGRRAKGAAEARDRQQSEARQDGDAAHQALAQGYQDVQAFDLWLQAHEPRYKALLPALKRMAGHVEATVPPAQWMDAMIGNYQILRDTHAAADPGTKANGKAPSPNTQPLRTGATAGDAPRRPVPKSMEQAIAQAVIEEED